MPNVRMHIIGMWAGVVVGYNAWLVRLALALFGLRHAGLGMAIAICVAVSAAVAAALVLLAARSAIRPYVAVISYCGFAALIASAAAWVLWYSGGNSLVGLSGQALAVAVGVHVAVFALVSLQLKQMRISALDSKAYAQLLGRRL